MSIEMLGPYTSSLLSSMLDPSSELPPMTKATASTQTNLEGAGFQTSSDWQTVIESPLGTNPHNLKALVYVFSTAEKFTKNLKTG